MIWLGALAFFLAGACVGHYLGTRSAFREGLARGCRLGYLRGLKKQVSVDDLIELFDEADREAFGSDGPPPERPEVTD